MFKFYLLAWGQTLGRSSVLWKKCGAPERLPAIPPLSVGMTDNFGKLEHRVSHSVILP
jgi:hypothetical protein